MNPGGRGDWDDASIAGLRAHVGLAAPGRRRSRLPRAVRGRRSRLRRRRSVDLSQAEEYINKLQEFE